MRERSEGFALGMALVLGLAILIMGTAGMIVSEMGFRSLSAEARWHMLEKAANYGLMKAIEQISSNSTTCDQLSLTNRTIYINGAEVSVTPLKAGESCFIWVNATLQNSTYVKTAIITPIWTDSNTTNELAPLMVKKFSSFNLGGSASIVNCEANCTTPAIITARLGNTTPIAEIKTGNCPDNPGGAVYSNASRVIYEDPSLENVDFTNRIFNANNRAELLNRLTQNFRVSFDNGRPTGIVGNITDISNIPNGSFEVCKLDVNECSASGSTITCSDYTATWEGGKYRVTKKNSPGAAFCDAIDFGQNAKIRFQTFSGGGTLMANEINLGVINNARIEGIGSSGITLIARNKVDDQANNVNSTNVNVFAQNIDINNNGLIWNGGIIYSGGAGNGNLNINIQSNTMIGTANNPVLIITDNNINIYGRGNAEIRGLIFATDATNNFNTANGNFKLYGALVSNSLKNNTYNANGNFDLYFSSEVLRRLASKFPNIVKQINCIGGSKELKPKKATIIQHMMGTY